MTTAGPSQRGRDGTGHGKPQEMMQHNAQHEHGATVPAVALGSGDEEERRQGGAHRGTRTM
jgi:hypothetical protein